MKRIVLGARGSDTGLWISKPGMDASSTSDDAMLVSPARYLLQPYMQGHVYAAPTANGQTSTSMVSMTITHNLGYIPVVEVFGLYQGGTPAFAQVNTKAVLLQGMASNGISSQFGTVYYAVDMVYVIFLAKLTAS